MSKRSVKKIAHMIYSFEKMNHIKSNNQNILEYLLPTLILNEMIEFSNNGEITLSDALSIGDEVVALLEGYELGIFNKIFRNIIIHLFEKNKINFFQFERDELEYYRMYFAGHVAENSNIKDCYYKASCDIAKIYEDERFLLYVQSQI